jgi:signal peptidase II
VKFKHVILLTLTILFLDQALKVYIKTHYHMGQENVLIPAIPWLRFHFLENEGMAYGWKLAGS